PGARLDLAGLAYPGLRVRGGLVDRGDHRPGPRLRLLAGVDRPGLEPRLTPVTHSLTLPTILGDHGSALRSARGMSLLRDRGGHHARVHRARRAARAGLPGCPAGVQEIGRAHV